MHCKNCETTLNQSDKYCCTCGAKVINGKITLRHLLCGVFESLGWDSQFFITFRDLVVKPQQVFVQYLNGTRKKYASPFTFFAIGAAVSVLCFNLFPDQLKQQMRESALNQSESIYEVIPGDEETKEMEKEEYINDTSEFNQNMINSLLKNYYYWSFLFLPLYAFIAFLIFYKPYSFAEHLVINAYAQGILFFFALILFFVNFIVKIDYNMGSFVLLFSYYGYAYTKLYRFTFGKILLKLLRSIVLLFLMLILFVVAGFVFKMISK